MKPTRKILEEMKPGDYVVVKTFGQLIDDDVEEIYDLTWLVKEKVEDLLGKMLPIEEVIFVEDVPIAVINYNDKTYFFGEQMFSQLYPLTRGLV